MRYIVPFYRRSDIYQYEWLKRGEFVKIIVPHPKLADGIRETSDRYRPDLNIESITIAEFIKNEISYWNSDITVCKKYRLILELSTIWKKWFPLSSYEEFTGVFDSFTRLRGVTTNFDLVEEVLSKVYMGLGERDVESIKKFWKYLEFRKIYDEHAACSYLVESYRNLTSNKTSEKMIFYGFSHLSSGQCELVNSMGKLHDIYIPLYASIWEKAEESDWMKWIDAQTLQIPLEKRETKKISLIKIKKNGLSKVMRKLPERYCTAKPVEIVLAEKTPDFFHVGELSWGEIFFKIETSVFLNTYTKIFNDMKMALDWKNDIDTQRVLKFLCGIIEKELNKNFEKKDFKIIKIASFIHDEIKMWMDLSEENISMKIFDFYVFRNTLKLNLPRNYIFPRMEKTMVAKVKGLEDIETIGIDGSVIVCATASHGDIEVAEDHLTEKMIESFLKIGPVKRKELELAITKENIKDVLGEKSSFLIIEENLIEESALWNSILSDVNINEIVFKNIEERTERDYIKNLKKKKYSLNNGKWSSAKIQKYLDCPRSFYYSYVERIHFNPENQQEVEAKELGSLEHKIISTFMEEINAWDEGVHDAFVCDIWEKFLQEKKLILDDLSYKNYFIEIQNYSWRGIKTLLEIKKNYPDAKFSFEVEFVSEIHRGSIDCVISLGDGMIGIVDFKRSEASVPSQKDILEFKKIQLWYYAHNLKLHEKQLCFFGYLCLAELEKSLLFFDEDIFTLEAFRKIFIDGKVKSCSLKNKKNQFEQILADKIDNVLKDERFLPIPQSENMCNFCWMDKVCIRETTADAGA